jgi:alpha-1,2-mannosyltransferase
MTIHTPEKQYWWQTTNKILTSRRLYYAIITGAALWITWILSIVIGRGNFDIANQVVGTDYIQFYTAGLTLHQGNSELLYDFDYQSELEINIAGPELMNFHAFITPPVLAWFFVPFSVLPYLWSFLAFSIVSLFALLFSIKLLRKDNPWCTFLWTLCWFPIFATISFGQNCMISLLILSLTYILWRRQRTFFAGMTASLILFKPQLIIGIAILWLVRWRKDWRALLGLLVGSGILGSLMFIFLPAATKDYVQLAINFLPNMIYRDQFPLYHLHALRGFWILLSPGLDKYAEIFSLLISLIGLGFFIRFVTINCNRPAVCYAAAIALTIFITPHAMIYDWTLLLIPAILLWQAIPQLKNYWKAVFSVIWLTTLLSGPLTYFQLMLLPRAIQISVPILFLLLINIRATVNETLNLSREVR